MNKIEQEVYDFMENQLRLYDNPHNVEIIMDGNSICAGCSWPNEVSEGDIYVGLCFECETIVDFIKIFGITSVLRIGAITPAMLLALYHQGIVEVYCNIDTGLVFYSLHFKKKKNKVMATNEQNEVHEVPGLLKTPEQFKEYTLQHYRVACLPDPFSLS